MVVVTARLESFLNGKLIHYIHVFWTADGGVVHKILKVKLSSDVRYATSSAALFFSKHGKALFVWQAMVQLDRMIKDPSG